MQRIKLIKVIYLALSFLICATISVSAKEFKIPALTDYYPYSFYSESDGWQGYGVDLANRLIQTPDNEHTLGYVINPTWERAINSIKVGGLDFLWEVSFTEERTESMEYIGVSDVQRMYLVAPETSKYDPIVELDDFIKIANASDDPKFSIVYSKWIEGSDEFYERIEADKDFASIFLDDAEIISVHGDEVWPGLLVALGRIYARILVETDANLAVSSSKSYMLGNSKAMELKAVPIPAFADSMTYMVIPKIMPDDLKQLIHNNYKQARTDGSFESIWRKWFPARKLPPDLVMFR